MQITNHLNFNHQYHHTITKEPQMFEDSRLPLFGEKNKPETIHIPTQNKVISAFRQVSASPLKVNEAAYHGIAGEIVHSIEPTTEADPIALLIQLLAGCGSIIGRTAHAMADGHIHYFNLFAVLVGSSSKGRKGTSWARIAQVLSHVDEDWLKNRVRSGLVSAEGLTHEVRDPVYGIDPRRRSSQDSELKETLLDPGVKDKRLFCLESEFASVLRNCERHGNTLSNRIRESWDGTPLNSLAKNSQTRCLFPHIGIAGHSTIDDILRHLSDIDVVNGFGNRFLWVYVQRSKMLPHGGNYIPDQRLLAQLMEVVHWGKSVGEMNRDSGANELWENVYPVLSGDKPGRYGALLNRAEAQVLRLSCLYALLDHSAFVKRQHLNAALALWDYCEASVHKIFGFKVGDKIADKILAELGKVHQLDRTQISKLFSNNKSSEDIQRALHLLSLHGLASSETIATTGGPREVWTLTKRTK